MHDTPPGHRRAAEAGQSPAAGRPGAVEGELEESNASRLMAEEMGGNAMAHGEALDLDRRHEESLDAAAEIERATADRRRGAPRPPGAGS